MIRARIKLYWLAPASELGRLFAICPMECTTEVETAQTAKPKFASRADKAMNPARGAIYGIIAGLMIWVLLAALAWGAVRCWDTLHGYK